MKTLVLRPRTLRPYVPLRLHLSESALRMNMFCITSSFENLAFVNLHIRHPTRSDAKHDSMSSFMKTLALGPRILRPYVPLRLHLSESALRMNMFCITSSFENLCKLTNTIL
ncbi:hypothetical protein SAMN05421730_100862 [Anaerobium acetethylicum]|uniref:Uncharacterized protein n=1 Tax=Anaerobium acetethylicum TaxID=1619234 RepID=A0A1D3TT33_9FIRM|nr:hypothetical protein SAMN05421730_100862 [Anaerobium acetethylicum]